MFPHIALSGYPEASIASLVSIVPQFGFLILLKSNIEGHYLHTWKKNQIVLYFNKLE